MNALRRWAGFAASVLFVCTLLAQSQAADAAQKGKTPPLPQPPPYGAYFLDQFRQDRNEHNAALDAIAKHYGYKNQGEAYRACLRSKENTVAGGCGDIVAHRRHESPEIAKYGFKTWKEAVRACIKNDKGEFGPVRYCTADPFLKLRSGT